MNINTYMIPEAVYGSLSAAQHASNDNQGINHLYVPSSVYQDYSNGWNTIARNIHEYDFDTDPDSILPQ